MGKILFSNVKIFKLLFNIKCIESIDDVNCFSSVYKVVSVGDCKSDLCIIECIYIIFMKMEDYDCVLLFFFISDIDVEGY